MSDSIDSVADDAPTLEPPGSITVVGGGPLGIEAALYGRFLGYDVTLVEAESIAYSLRSRLDQPLPMLPDRCLSPLAVAAIRTQKIATHQVDPDNAEANVLPTTHRQWIDEWLIPLTESDLLKDSLRMPARVTDIARHRR